MSKGYRNGSDFTLFSALLQEKWAFFFLKERRHLYYKTILEIHQKEINLERSAFATLDIATVLNTDFKLTIKMITAYS